MKKIYVVFVFEVFCYEMKCVNFDLMVAHDQKSLY